LIRYAAAMGKTWGPLPDDLSHFQAYAVRHETASRSCRSPNASASTANGRGLSRSARPFTSVRFLDWDPGEPTEELLYEAA